MCFGGRVHLVCHGCITGGTLQSILCLTWWCCPYQSNAFTNKNNHSRSQDSVNLDPVQVHQKLINPSCCFWDWEQEFKMLITDIYMKLWIISQAAVNVREHALPVIRTTLCNILLLQTKLITDYLTFPSAKHMHTGCYCPSVWSHLAFSLNNCSPEMASSFHSSYTWFDLALQ